MAYQLKDCRIDPDSLAMLRARLVLALGREVDWGEFATICELAPSTLSNLKAGRTPGSIKTANLIRRGCAKHKVYVRLTDIISER
jgi:hypothetical protein